MKRDLLKTSSAHHCLEKPLLCFIHDRVRKYSCHLYYTDWEVGEHWAGKAIATSDNRGKMLRRDGFALAEDRYSELTATWH